MFLRVWKEEIRFEQINTIKPLLYSSCTLINPYWTLDARAFQHGAQYLAKTRPVLGTNSLVNMRVSFGWVFNKFMDESLKFKADIAGSRQDSASIKDEKTKQTWNKSRLSTVPK